MSQVNPQGGPGYSRRIVYWDGPDSPARSFRSLRTYADQLPDIPQEAAWGLNSAGHILVGSYDCAATSGDGTVAAISSFR